MAQKPVLVLGSGIAGLSAALKIARHHPVTVVSKAALEEGATRYAQGGIASVWSEQDSFEDHKRDTLTAGAGLCAEEVVDLCVQSGPARVRELIEYGVSFTRSQQDYDLHKEGGHQHRRILHADDITGRAIEEALVKHLKASPNVTILENHTAIDLITEGKLLKSFRKPGRVLGAYVLDAKGEVHTLGAHTTLLATGGAGKVYLYTTNPDTATGDGVAMAHRAGARVANLEFMQFHPTCLYHPEAKNFLISEALRGEGAELFNLQGHAFMGDYDERGSLAPRDVVARAIDSELKRSGDRYVLLRTSKVQDLPTKFPNITRRCEELGIDVSRSIPVVPAAHYTCGGVVVDTHGATTLEGLYAIGEVSCSGLHGANRLASNSLLEGVVFARRAADRILSDLHESSSEAPLPPALPQWEVGHAVPLEEQLDIASLWLEIRTLMWNYVGIVRSNRRMEKARRRLSLIAQEVEQAYWDYHLTRDLIELRNLLKVAGLVVESASLRKESRGLHYTVDHPEPSDSYFLHDTVL